AEFDVFSGLSKSAAYDIFIGVKYEGYLRREEAAAANARRVGDLSIPPDTDFSKMNGLRLEAREKLAAVRPLTVGQASRISGVTPADVNVLILRLGR
ncbi:MAG: tRNA uridine-5-carboxymethylaminomethyl(34) synthesis enzyme MnmG, partial [Firmicutes bacterium]|nr:tRNA uridine-5-carboxymethylaminomethyl(34) synthesis enzyme MnmG [Bacillota bacterium]